MRTRWIIVLAVASVLLVGVGLFAACPPIWFHNHWRGRGLWGTRATIYTATASKDGKLAIVMKDQGRVRVSLMEPTKTRRVDISHGLFDADPAWDASGTRIAYTSLLDGDRIALHILDVARDSDTVILERRLISQPQWSPDGKSILFLDNIIRNKAYMLYRIPVAGGKITPVACPGFNRPQAWAIMPDGDSLVYPAQGFVWITSILKGTTRRLSLADISKPCMVSASPDGKHLFVCESGSNSQKKAYVVNPGTGQNALVATGSIRYALWSPSGRYLATAGYLHTDVYDMQNRTSASREGVAISWRTETKLVLIPTMDAPHTLIETDITRGKTHTILSL